MAPDGVILLAPWPDHGLTPLIRRSLGHPLLQHFVVSSKISDSLVKLKISDVVW